MSTTIDFSEYGLFKRKDGTKVTYEDLMQDIYNNSEETRDAIRLLVTQMTELIDSPDTALQLLESVSGLLETSVKNDDLLVKIAAIVSRIIQRGMATKKDTDTEWEISPEEIKQLINESEEVLDASMGLMGKTE